ncbi:MAG: hypothetical protein KF746_27225 [Chitinophagaceae bacterium]|nr:hypothetical protein [Chitinophagaceae bacterium]
MIVCIPDGAFGGGDQLYGFGSAVIFNTRYAFVLIGGYTAVLIIGIVIIRIGAVFKITIAGGNRKAYA